MRIEIEYENGDVYQATGDDAFEISRWWNSGAAMNIIHGHMYTGPVMKKVSKRIDTIG